LSDGFAARPAAAPLARRDRQPVWTDRSTGFRRRSVSPPAGPLAGEVIECTLEPERRIDYDRPPRPGLEHHLLLLDGRLRITVGGEPHDLRPGDCLRYRLTGPSSFSTPAETGVRYLVFMV
jgi:quercetin dioxygenase-like cupin family protein